MSGETIQHFIDSGDTCQVWCHGCHHHAFVDMLKLRDRLGPDHGSMHDDIIHLFRCSKCGGKELGLIHTPRGNELKRPGGDQRNLYAKARDG